MQKFIFSAGQMCDIAQMDWQDLRYFVALARTGTLSAAARELRVDHATVGRRVAALERTLGVRLIDRLPRRALLTNDGKAVAALAESMEGTAHLVERYVRGAADPATATVRVSASPAVAARLIAPQVAAFHRTNPGIALLLSGSSGMAAMDRGEADLAVRLIRPEDPDLIVSQIGVMRFSLYATRDQAALPSEKLGFIAYEDVMDYVGHQIWMKSQLAGRPIVFRASDLFAQHEAARAGLGAVVLPTFMGDNDSELVRLPITSKPPTRGIWLVTYPDLRRSPAIRRVMDFLGDAISKGCPKNDSLSIPGF